MATQERRKAENNDKSILFEWARGESKGTEIKRRAVWNRSFPVDSIVFRSNADLPDHTNVRKTKDEREHKMINVKDIDTTRLIINILYFITGMFVNILIIEKLCLCDNVNLMWSYIALMKSLQIIVIIIGRQ